MWLFKRRKDKETEDKQETEKTHKTEDKQETEKTHEIKVKLGESFVLRPGKSASFEIPIPAEIYNVWK